LNVGFELPAAGSNQKTECPQPVWSRHRAFLVSRSAVGR